MIYVFLANGFEEMEAMAPIDCLRRAGKQVVTVAVGGAAIRSSHGMHVIPDLTEQEITLDDSLEMIVLPGGMPGTLNLENSEQVQKAIAYCAAHDKWIAAASVGNCTIWGFRFTPLIHTGQRWTAS